MREIVIDTRERLTAGFTARIERTSAAAIATRRRFSIAVAGGSVAQAFLPGLATAAVDWSCVDVFWCDERAVPPGDPESNYGAAGRLLFSRILGPSAVLHRMPADASDLDRAAREYEADLRNTLGPLPRLDLMLIGAGRDGHICSLFPEHPVLAERERLVAAIDDAPKAPPRRLTMTLPVLGAARCLYLGAFGGDKAAMVREILEDESSPLPAAQALRSNGSVVCLFDYEAASLLGASTAHRHPPD